MGAQWELVPVGSVPGDAGQILIVNREDGADGRTVCVVPGKLLWHREESDFVRRLDEQDIQNAQTIVTAPKLRAALASLVEWAARTGGWEAPCWEEAQALLAALRDPSSAGENGPESQAAITLARDVAP